MFNIEKTNHKNHLLNQIIITNSEINLACSIYPNLGASLQKLNYKNIEIIDGIESNTEGLATYTAKYNSSLLFPFPNRIPDGKYTFENVDYKVACNESANNNALHGHIFNKHFEVTKTETTKSSASVKLTYTNKGEIEGFPFPHKVEVLYYFTKENISITFNAINTGDKNFPFGLGFHPYFKATHLSECRLDFEADKQYLVNDRMIPIEEIPLKFKTPLLLKETALDDCFITKKSKASLLTGDYKIEMNFTSAPPHSFLQVYTPPTRDCIAIEPMTCAPNSFNNKNGLLVLKPEENYQWQVNMNYSIVE